MKKILIVDDDPTTLHLITTSLSACGHTIITAANGQEGCDKLKTETPDLIISDMLMPVMDGITFYKNIKKNKATANIPVLILTGRGKMEDSLRVMGVNDFLAKPFKSSILISKIENLLNGSSSAPVPASSKKFLVGGNYTDVVNTIAMQLKKLGCPILSSFKGNEIITKCTEEKPDVFLLELLMLDMPTHEIINKLRRIPQFTKTPILTYSFYQTSDLRGEDLHEMTSNIDSAQEKCEQVGATTSIGRFNENSFLKTITPYL